MNDSAVTCLNFLPQTLALVRISVQGVTTNFLLSSAPLTAVVCRNLLAISPPVTTADVPRTIKWMVAITM